MSGFFVLMGWAGSLGTLVVGLTNGSAPGLAFAGGFFVPYLFTLTLLWLVDR